jgi:hypothetical protein
MHFTNFIWTLYILTPNDKMSAITSVLGKRERPPYARHFFPSGPGQMPSLPNRPIGPSAPPTVGSQISVQSRSTVKYLEVNPTGSIPIMIRPWLDHYEKDYAPGSIIFCKQEKTGRSPLITCADVPTLNYLFHRGRNGIGEERDLIQPSDFEFFGVFRNDAGKQVDHLGFPRYTNPKQRLIQCDVYGRAKVANFFGNKLRTGQRVGLALVVKTVNFVKQPNRHSRNLPGARKVWQIVPMVNDCTPGTDNLITEVARQANDDQTLLHPPNEGRYIKRWHLGVVSQAAYEPPTFGKINLALHDSQQRTDLPQIEILMI